MSAPPDSKPAVHPRAAFQHRDFRLYQLARLVSIVGVQVMSVAVGWQVYSQTKQSLALGFVGLAQFLPAFALSPITGHVADRFDRRRIVLVYHAGIACCALALALLAHAHTTSLWPIYVVLALSGTFRAFAGPASSALMPSLVPVEHFSNAAAWSASIWQVSTVVGPALGGLVYWAAGEPTVVYSLTVLTSLAGFVTISLVQPRGAPSGNRGMSIDTLLEGVRYVWANKILLGALSLDLFAVLLGGAVAMLPVYAQDVLHVGPRGFGLLRSAPAFGAAATAIVLAYRPIERNSGRVMFASVAVFGVATVVFGVSKLFFVSLFALLIAGASDMVSVYIRSILTQLNTPDALRGRVNAVNQVFVGASNELGEFESGLTAHWFGTVPSVVVGGIGTLVVVLVWAWRFPALRAADRLRAG